MEIGVNELEFAVYAYSILVLDLKVWSKLEKRNINPWKS